MQKSTPKSELSIFFGCVHLSVCVGDYAKTKEQIFMEFMFVWPDKRKKLLNLREDLDHILDTKIARIFNCPIFSALGFVF